MSRKENVEIKTNSLLEFIKEEVPFRLIEVLGMPVDKITDEVIQACVDMLYNDCDIMFDYDRIDRALEEKCDEMGVCKEEIDQKHTAILYDGMLTAQEYLELMTGCYYVLYDDNQLALVERIIDSKFGEGAYWNYSLTDLGEVSNNGGKVVLVEIVNITEDCEQERLCRFFEVPSEWTKEIVEQKLIENKSEGQGDRF